MTSLIKASDFVFRKSDEVSFDYNKFLTLVEKIGHKTQFEEPEFYEAVVEWFWAPPDWRSGPLYDMIKKFETQYGCSEIRNYQAPFIYPADNLSQFTEECAFIKQATGWQLLEFIKNHKNNVAWLPRILNRCKVLYEQYGTYLVPQSESNLIDFLSEIALDTFYPEF